MKGDARAGEQMKSSIESKFRRVSSRSQAGFRATAFPLLVLLGVLLVVWGTIVSPEDLQDGRQIVRWQWGVKADGSFNSFDVSLN
ncbi:MAG: hypothetical protein AB7F66_17525 [Bacteriovoracia bacterium]